MDRHEAERIVNQYGGAIADNEHTFRKKSALPYSKAKIRHAYFVYIPAILDNMGKLSEDLGQTLTMTYSLLNSFIDDTEAERLNTIETSVREHKLDATNPEHKKQIDEYFARVQDVLPLGKDFDEINDFITECYRERSIDPAS